MKRAFLGITTVLLMTGLFFLPAWSAPVDSDLAATVGEVFIQKEMGSGVTAPGEIAAAFSPLQSQVAGVTALKNDAGDTVAYVLEPSHDGYVVVSADTQITPIIAYAYSGKFSFADTEDNLLLQMVKADMTMRLEALSELAAEEKAANEALWDDLQWNTAPRTASTWGPWLKTKWHEKNPFWEYCPIDPDSQGRVHVGSGGTAMAQIEFYHKYPKSMSFGSADSYTTKTKKIKVNTTNHGYYGAGYLKFATLSKYLKKINYKGKGTSRVKKGLSFGSGIAAKMDYVSGKSMADLKNIRKALKYKFKFRGCGYYSGKKGNFYRVAQSNMKKKRPAIVEILKSSNIKTARKVVMDGYKATGHYHLNYGQGAGGFIGWYKLPKGMPGGYKIVNAAIFNIIPR